MKITFIILLLLLCGLNFLPGQESEPPKPEKVIVKGTVTRNPDTGNINLITSGQVRYFIIPGLHKKVDQFIGKQVTITGGAKPGKDASSKLMAYIGKVEPVSGGNKGGTPIPAKKGLPALKAATKGRFYIGVGTSVGTLDNGRDTALLKRHFDIITPENCMKSTKVQKKEGVFDFEKADRLVSFAEKNDIDICGHCLIWARPGTTPEWFFKDGDKPVSKEKLLARLRTHIHTVAGRYRGRVKMWDVVNEALADRDDEYLRDIEWNNILGEEFLVKAFQYAKQADPDALLIYNDYRCDHPGKLKKLVRLIKSVKAKGGPIEALGLQAHYEYDKIPYEGIENAMREMRKLGVKVVFSELDMDVTTRARWYHDGGKYREEMKSWDPYPNGPPEEILKSQARQYAKLFTLISQNSDVVERVTFWNLHDGHSWLNYWPWTRTNHPLLFDRQGKAKPAFFAVQRALQ